MIALRSCEEQTKTAVRTQTVLSKFSITGCTQAESRQSAGMSLEGVGWLEKRIMKAFS